jgi:pyrroline-5-carboxylate reductase
LKALVFLGGGRITSALIAGLRLTQGQAEIIAPQIIVPKIIVPQIIVPKIIVHDRNPEKLRELRRKYRVGIELDLHRAVAQAGLLVIAVRPDSVRELPGFR